MNDAVQACPKNVVIPIVLIPGIMGSRSSRNGRTCRRSCDDESARVLSRRGPYNCIRCCKLRRRITLAEMHLGVVWVFRAAPHNFMAKRQWRERKKYILQFLCLAGTLQFWLKRVVATMCSTKQRCRWYKPQSAAHFTTLRSLVSNKKAT